MSDAADSGEKEHEPSPRKLEQARSKGEIPRSTDLTTAAAYAGLVAAGLATGGAALQAVGQLGAVLLGQPDQIAPAVFSDARSQTSSIMGSLARAMAPFYLVPPAAVLAMLFAQRALVFAPDKLKPKVSRISMLSNAKQKFGRNGLFEFAKSFVKLLVISALLWLFLIARLPAIIGTMQLTPGLVSAELLALVVQFFALVVLILFVIGGVDLLWQTSQHLHRNRMSHKELRDEIKQSEGDPHVKQQRRQRGHDIATNRMIAEVPSADVVIVNPEHYAIALKWDRKAGSAPVCVAKGTDFVAARIREAAATAGVPIHRDPPTARALHATVDLGEEIRTEHYRAVAAAIRFAESMRRRARPGE